MNETGKQRASRMPLEYYKAPNLLERWHGRLGWAALAITLGGLALSWGITKEPHFGASPGPVSDVHLAWNDNCMACHEPFQAISSHSWAPPGMAHSSGMKCQVCHAGPIHHANQKTDLSCAACHRDHKGPGHSLIRLADADCTQCHQNLAAHCSDTPRFENVSLFASGTHPAFRSIKKDPGRLKFNHALHMTEGMPVRDKKGVGGTTLTLGGIPEAYRERYRRLQKDKRDEAPVQLACVACHQLDAEDFPLTTEAFKKEVSPATRPPRGVGEYYLPITYENQCQACHRLQVAETLPDGKLQAVTVPHRLQPPELDRWLRDHFTAQAARGQAGFFERKVERPLPGKKIGDLLAPELKKLLDANLERATRELYRTPELKKNCSLCHEVDADAPPGKAAIPATDVPQIWLKHARFDHMAHRAVDCRLCHKDAYALNADGAANPTTSTTHKDVLTPGIDNCLLCHSPPGRGTHEGKSVATGGARFNCTECHRYHHGDAPLAGRGASVRAAPKLLDLSDFLKASGK